MWRGRGSSHLECSLAFINQHFELINQLLKQLPSVQEQADHEESSEEPELLVGDGEVLKQTFLEILACEDGLVEDVRLGEVVEVAGSHVLTEVELANA